MAGWLNYPLTFAGAEAAYLSFAAAPGAGAPAPGAAAHVVLAAAAPRAAADRVKPHVHPPQHDGDGTGDHQDGGGAHRGPALLARPRDAAPSPLQAVTALTLPVAPSRIVLSVLSRTRPSGHALCPSMRTPPSTRIAVWDVINVLHKRGLSHTEGQNFKTRNEIRLTWSPRLLAIQAEQNFHDYRLAGADETTADSDSSRLPNSAAVTRYPVPQCAPNYRNSG